MTLAVVNSELAPLDGSGTAVVASVTLSCLAAISLGHTTESERDNCSSYDTEVVVDLIHCKSFNKTNEQ